MCFCTIVFINADENSHRAFCDDALNTYQMCLSLHRNTIIPNEPKLIRNWFPTERQMCFCSNHLNLIDRFRDVNYTICGNDSHRIAIIGITANSKRSNSMTHRTTDSRIDHYKYIQTYLMPICICFDPSKDRIYFQTQSNRLICFFSYLF